MTVVCALMLLAGNPEFIVLGMLAAETRKKTEKLLKKLEGIEKKSTF